ncbi:MAG TPA: hypothetical protein VFH54_10875 [Mycobacteriales bacterium]|nr:hypothetical protein [Mycobacteriales bacterium]
MTLAAFWQHTITVETYQGQGSSGPVYAAPVQVTGLLDTVSDLARVGTVEEATSASSMFYTDPSNAALFTVQTRVTSALLDGDGKATVVKVNSLTSGGLGLPDHVEVALQ